MLQAPLTLWAVLCHTTLLPGAGQEMEAKGGKGTLETLEAAGAKGKPGGHKLTPSGPHAALRPPFR